MIYVIEDWAGNILDYTGRFKLPAHVVPMEFESFEDGWMYLDGIGVSEEDAEEYFVVTK